MEQNKIEIRKMNMQDIEAVTEIEKICFTTPWSEQAYKETLVNPSTMYLVAELTEPEEKRIVGMCGVLKLMDEGDISNVAVHPMYRRQRIGRQMLEELLKRGKEWGMDSFTLEVRAGNEAAIQLYESFGFRTEGVRKCFYDRPVEDALIMWKRREDKT